VCVRVCVCGVLCECVLCAHAIQNNNLVEKKHNFDTCLLQKYIYTLALYASLCFSKVQTDYIHSPTFYIYTHITQLSYYAPSSNCQYHWHLGQSLFSINSTRGWLLFYIRVV